MESVKRVPAQQFGITLIELLIVLSIAAVLLAVGTGYFRDSLLNSQRTGNVNLFISTLYLARTEAVGRTVRVTVCKSSTGTDCTEEGGWEQGWLVFEDPNANAQLDSGEQTLWKKDSLSEATLRGNLYVRNYISYVPLGVTRMVSGAFQAGTFIYCDERGYGEEATAIIVSSSGRPRSAPATESSVSDCEP